MPLRAALFLTKAVRDARSAEAWLTFLSALEQKHYLAPASIETVAKPFGNYAAWRLSSSRRVSMLLSHYNLLAMTMPTVLSTIWSGASVELGYLEGKRGQRYRLTLDPARHNYKEGELSVTLTDAADGLQLAKLTFLFIILRDSDEPALLIGGLQGPSSYRQANAKTRIVSATRALSGLRPKMAVFEAASAFAIATGSKSLHAVSNRTHTINADAAYQRRKMYADYDAFWIERGGMPGKFGFKLPLNVAPKSQSVCRNEQRAQVSTLVYRLFELPVSAELDELSVAIPDSGGSVSHPGIDVKPATTTRCSKTCSAHPPAPSMVGSKSIQAGASQQRNGCVEGTKMEASLAYIFEAGLDRRERERVAASIACNWTITGVIRDC